MTSSTGWTKLVLTPRRVVRAGLLVAVAVWVVAVFRIGRFGPSAVFAGICTFLVVATVGLFFKVARALLHEPAEAERSVATGRRRKELEREKQSLVKALKELDFDHQMGKISEADWKEIGGLYRQRAVRVLRQLDAEVGDYRALVEREVARRRGAAPKGSVRPRCGHCSTENDRDADFCKRCGKPLTDEAKVGS